MMETNKSGDSVEQNLSKNRTSGLKLVLASILLAVIAVASDRFVLSPVLSNVFKQEEKSEQGVQFVQNGGVDEEIVSLFVNYDEDLDGVINLAEFVQVGNRILNREVVGDSHQKIPIENGLPRDLFDSTNGEEDNLMIVSYFTPLVLSSMEKYSTNQNSDFYNENEKQMQGLKSWTMAHVPSATFSMKEFKAFLPAPDQTLNLLQAQPWYILEARVEKDGPGLTNNRYYPPVVKGRLAIIFKLLAMFHPRPFVLTRFSPQGSVACIRAENNEFLDIVFRIHAEYQLNEPPLLPFWFTPGQFLGNIVMKKDGSHVESFHLAVPNNRSLNVDMEWIVKQKEEADVDVEMEVDIGFLPQLELRVEAPMPVNDIKWDSEISFEEAYKAIEEKFYGFKKVSYVPFQNAVVQAKTEKKLLHHILVWGALDDQSC